MRRLLAAVVVLLVAAPAAGAAPAKPKPKAAAKPIVGLSDQTPAPFASPLFAPLSMKNARSSPRGTSR